MADLRANYSMLSTFQQCRRKYWFKFVERVRVPWKQNVDGIIGRGIHESLARYAASDDPEVGRSSLDAHLRMPNHAIAGPGTPFYEFAMALYERGVEACRSIQAQDTWIEQNLRWYWRKADLEFDAILDRVDYLGDGHWQIIDWKTGNYEFGETTDLQLDIAHAVLRAARNLPRDALVTTIGWNLRHETQRVRMLNRGHAAATMRLLLNSARKIAGNQDFSGSPSRLCAFCEFREQCDDAQFVKVGRLDWEDELTQEQLDDDSTSPS